VLVSVAERAAEHGDSGGTQHLVISSWCSCCSCRRESELYCLYVIRSINFFYSVIGFLFSLGFLLRARSIEGKERELTCNIVGCVIFVVQMVNFQTLLVHMAGCFWD